MIVYLTGNYIKRKDVSERKKRAAFVFSIALNIGLLVFFKYVYFFITSIAELISLFGSGYPDTNLSATSYFFASLAIPLGISYLTFQSIGYLIEVNRGTIEAEKNVGVLAGYLLFFPKLIAGPVERAAHFLPQIKPTIIFDYDRISSGMKQFGWGLFKKLLIADRLGLFVNSVYADVHHNTGYSLLIAAILFPIQLYADFSGYTDMALGLAKILGYDLQPNFNQPFSAKSIVELWRKWHISLSAWFNDYFYTPIVIKKRDLGKWSVVCASMTTFLILGLWHGPNWTYVIFGGIQGFFIALELFTSKARKRLRKNIPVQINNIAGMIYMFVIFSFSCIFFRSGGVADALYFIRHLFSGVENLASLKVSLQSHALAMSDYVIAILTIPCMFFVEAKGLSEWIVHSPIWIRWPIYYLFLSVIIVYGVSSGAGFIYKQF
ncbi:MAG: MBOAT family O-acyltransferase [Bacteroidota bacterium]